MIPENSTRNIIFGLFYRSSCDCKGKKEGQYMQITGRVGRKMTLEKRKFREERKRVDIHNYRGIILPIGGKSDVSFLKKEFRRQGGQKKITTLSSSHRTVS